MIVQQTIAIGDIVVAVSMIASVLCAYYAARADLKIMKAVLERLECIIDDHDDRLDNQQQDIANLNAHVFGRRTADARRHAKT